MEITDEHRKILKILDPLITALTKKVNEFPEMCFTGFIYKPSDPPMLLQVGNISDQGENLVKVHWILANMAARLHQTGQFAPADEYRQSYEKSGPSTPDPLEVADRMALALLATPLEMLPSHVSELLEEYAKSRRPEEK
jgi:hypothetical protein